MSCYRKLWFALVVPLLLGLTSTGSVLACGGFFCTTIPVDQAAERIIFTMDGSTVGTYVQINYTGSPDDFAWVLPVPSVPTLAQADMATFRDLDRMTAPQWIPPRAPDCLMRRVPMPAAAAAEGRAGVDVLASGVVGPFGYHVVTSPDPQEMVRWLRDNGYQIDPSMEPLIEVYTDEGMAFLAMRLQPGKGTSEITPIKLEYAATQPMIPLRLTAVAAQPDMPVLTWIFSTGRTQPINYVDMTISDGEVGFNPFGANNYRQVVSTAADQAGGRAFVTEYAGSTLNLRPSDATAQLLVSQYPYLTRFYTRISPEEMTVDPVFDLASGKGDVSNVHDLSRLPTPFSCSDDFSTFKTIPGAGGPPPVALMQRTFERFGASGAPRGGLMALVLLGLTAVALRVRKPDGGWRMAGGKSLRARLLPPLLPLRLPPSAFRLPPISTGAARILLLEALLLQGFHEVEHIVQVVQRTFLNVKLGSGVLGSVFDVEPVHFLYNLTFLALLTLAFVGLRQSGAIPRNRGLVLALLGFAVAGQAYHGVEHVVKMVQFVETGRNGTPGILGHWIHVVWLHLGFNTVLYLPVVAALFVGGFHQRLGRDLAGMLPRLGGRRTRPGGQPA